MNLVLIGYRATGKTTVGRKLSALLGRVFVDTDDLIEERQGKPINEIVKSFGWDYFRAIEKEVISAISNENELIIAAGGGVILQPENIEALKRNGFLLWLRADLSVLFQRMVKDHRTATGRPSLTGKGALEELEEVMAQREDLYARASSAQVDTSSLDMDGVVNNILFILKEKIGRP